MFVYSIFDTNGPNTTGDLLGISGCPVLYTNLDGTYDVPIFFKREDAEWLANHLNQNKSGHTYFILPFEKDSKYSVMLVNDSLFEKLRKHSRIGLREYF